MKKCKIKNKITLTDLKLDVENMQSDFDLDFKFNSDFAITEIHDIKSIFLPKPKKQLYPKLNYQKAIDLIEELKADFSLEKDYFFIVTGEFVFGDFFTEFLRTFNIQAKEITISTLSFSAANINALKLLVEDNFIKKINLVVSHYFYSHERNKLLQMFVNELAPICEVNIGVDRIHCKTTLIETSKGTKIVFSGSANFRSSQNYEQLMLNVNNDLYDFNYNFFQKILTENKIEIYGNNNG